MKTRVHVLPGTNIRVHTTKRPCKMYRGVNVMENGELQENNNKRYRRNEGKQYKSVGV